MTTPTAARLRSLATLSHLTAYTQTTRHGAPTAPSTATAYDASLIAATRDLRQLIIDTELVISSLGPSSPTPSSELTANLAAFCSPDYIPPPDSPLNTLLAYRSILRTISAHAHSLPDSRAHAAASNRVLSDAETLAAEECALHTALEARVAALEDRPVGEAPPDLVGLLKGREKEVRRRMGRAMKALTEFVDGTLTEMLETEEAGGPVVGMAVGGEGKKSKGQKTIEEMWRVMREEGAGVGVEMKALLERLMNESLGGGGYVDIDRESAAARFLVRSRVAVFHPRDARRIRLVDFGGTFEEV